MKYHRISTGKVEPLGWECVAGMVWYGVMCVLVVVTHCQEQWHDSTQYEHEQF